MAETAGWTFEIRERSAGVYDGIATHVSGATIAATGENPDALLDRLRRDTGSA